MGKAVNKDVSVSSSLFGNNLTKDLDIVVFNYMGSNPASLLSDKAEIGSFREIEQIKELTPLTKNKKVAFYIQGYERQPDGRFDTKRYHIQNGSLAEETSKIDGVKNIYDQNLNKNGIFKKIKYSGDDVTQFNKATLEDFLIDGYCKFPSAQNYYLSVSTHGGGYKGIGGEAVINDRLHCGLTGIMEKMSLAQVKDAIKKAGRKTGKKISLLNFNACLMGAAEVISSLKDTAEFIVASPEVEKEDAFKDDKSKTSFQATTPVYITCIEDSESMSPEKFGRIIIDKTKENTCENGYSDVPTLSMYATKDMPEFEILLGRLGEMLIGALQDKECRKKILGSINETFCYYEKDYKDLRDFLARLEKGGVLEACSGLRLKEKINVLMEKITIYTYKGKTHSKDYSNCGPFSIYIPTVITEERIKEEIWSLTKPITDLQQQLNITLGCFRPDDKIENEDKLGLLDRIGFIKMIIKKDLLEKLKEIEGAKEITDLLGRFDAEFNELYALAEKYMDKDGKTDRELIKNFSDEDFNKIISNLSFISDGLKNAGFSDSIKRLFVEGASRKIKKSLLEESIKKIDTDLKKYKKLKTIPDEWIKFVEEILEINKKNLNEYLLI